MVYIAQLVRVLDCGSRGHRFNPDYTPCVRVGYWLLPSLSVKQESRKRCAGSIPVVHQNAVIAQLVERFRGKEEVVCSIQTYGSNKMLMWHSGDCTPLVREYHRGFESLHQLKKMNVKK